MTSRKSVAALSAIVAVALSPLFAEAADPDALRQVVEGLCVPHEAADGNPAPCRLVDLADRYVVLKDLFGRTQYLVIATDAITGIESPALLANNARDYWQDAWGARRFVDESAGQAVPRDFIGLAINSVKGRTQNQLHIHIDCVKPEVVAALRLNEAGVGPSWQRLPFALSQHFYLAMRLEATDLSGVNPFRLLADGVPSAKADMGDQTLVVIGATFKDHRDGFYLLSDHASGSDIASGEELLDHSCAALRQGAS